MRCAWLITAVDIICIVLFLLYTTRTTLCDERGVESVFSFYMVTARYVFGLKI